jgi:type 1 glutamine amidotransferase
MLTPRSDFPKSGATTVAVVTGAYPYDVVGLHNLFLRLDGVNAYIQHFDDFIYDWGSVRTEYDVVLFYNWHRITPSEGENVWRKPVREALMELGDTKQGIIVLHHALDAFPKWDFWSDLVGFDRSTWASASEGKLHFEESIPITVVDPEHPITRGMDNFTIEGETWETPGIDDVGPYDDCNVLLTTDHPKQTPKQLAWTRTHNEARVMYLQPGHDLRSFEDRSFRTILQRGIQWTAGRLSD